MRFYVALLTIAAALGPAGAETAVERGGYLVNVLAACAGCHTQRTPAGPALSGGNTFGISGIVAPNITPDAETGIGAWTDRQIVDAIRNGMRPDGSRLAPPMPQWAYRWMSDEDTAAIVAYIRTVAPVHHVIPIAQTRKPSAPKAQVVSVATPPFKTPFERGQYIANALSHCTECHTPGPRSEPDVAHHLNEGGRVFVGPKGSLVSPNITATSLRRYSDIELMTMITRGIRPDGTTLEGPMPVKSYAGFNPGDLTDLVVYLRASSAPTAK